MVGDFLPSGVPPSQSLHVFSRGVFAEARGAQAQGREPCGRWSGSVLGWGAGEQLQRTGGQDGGPGPQMKEVQLPPPAFQSLISAFAFISCRAPRGSLAPQDSREIPVPR